nr:F-box domain-containing protein [Cedratvirus duvanny]
MDALPLEIQENILLSLVEPDDLLRACSTSRQNREICSGSVFWREKFSREDLPLLQEGYSFASWTAIYKKAFQAAQTADRLVNSGEDILIRLSEIFDLRHLGFVVYKDIREIWQETREGNNSHTYFVVDGADEEHQVTIHSDYYLVFTPSSGLYSMDLVDYPQSTDGEEILPERIQTRFGPTLTKEDMWKVVYRMAFFGYIFP